MMYLNFARIFRIKDIRRPFTYLQTIGYSGGYATKLANNRIDEINVSRLERFCRDFNCTPNDVFDFKPGPKDALPKDHALHALTKTDYSDINEKISKLPADKIQRIHEMIKNME